MINKLSNKEPQIEKEKEKVLAQVWVKQQVEDIKVKNLDLVLLLETLKVVKCLFIEKPLKEVLIL